MKLSEAEFIRRKKAVIRALVRDCGGQEACVLIEGMPHERHQAFSEFGSTDEANFRKLPRGHVLYLLEAECGAPHYTRMLADLHGYELFRRPGLRRGPGAAVRAIKEAAESISAIADLAALSGQVDAATRVRTLREIEEAITALLEERAVLLASEDEGQ